MNRETNYQAAYERERTSRLRAEELLENKTREIYRINEQLKANAHALAQSNEALTQFAFVASHDLKEPLRKIKMFANFLMDECSGQLPDEGKDYMKRMHNAVDRMESLIEGLLKYSRITRNEELPVEIDLGELIDEIINDLSVRIQETKANISIVSQLPTISANSTQIRQLLQNLISNAIKFHQPDQSPQIKIDAKLLDNKAEPWCEISISDNGIGFEEKYINKLFGIFQRLHTHSTYEGNGIGLAVCKKIVERHRGEIQVSSTPGVGSVFTISLPTTQRTDE